MVYKNSRLPTPNAQRIWQLTFIALSFFFIVSTSTAAEPTVEVAAISTSVENLIPIGVSEAFPANIGKLYCYSKIIGGEGRNIRHAWYLNEKKIGEVALPIKGISYRTYSLRTIYPWMKGKGRVDITTEDGKILKSVDFEIK